MLAFQTNICYNPPLPPLRTPGPMPAPRTFRTTKKGTGFQGLPTETAPAMCPLQIPRSHAPILHIPHN